MAMNVDHVTLCGPELEALRKAFAHAGLETEYGGPHANGVTHMALLGFGDGSYLELIAPQTPGETAGSHWGGMMTEAAGCCAWAVTVENIQREVSRLNSVGIETKGPLPGSRKRPDGKVLRWEIASAGPGEPGAMLPFMIQDHTPREWRVQPPMGANEAGLTGVVTVVLGVKDMRAASEMFRRAYGWDEPDVREDFEFGSLAHFAGTPVMLASHPQESSWLVKRLRRFGERPAAFLLGAHDLRDAARQFHLSKVEEWFGREVAWFEGEQFPVLRLGVSAV